MTNTNNPTAYLSTIADYVRYGTSRFNAAQLGFHHGFDSALDEATYLVLHALHLPTDMPPVYAQASLLPAERAEILQRFDRRIAGTPSAYITGEAWFAGLAFEVNSDVLIPRSPLAELIEQGFAPWLTSTPERILDLCTGSGCIAAACAVQFVEAEVDAVDISDAALAVATRNFAAHGLSERVQALQSDLFQGLKGRKYDLIVSNPPYVAEVEMQGLTQEFQHEPALGLVSGSDGLDAPLAILDEATEHLTSNGLLVLEVGGSESTLLDLLPDLPGEWVEFERSKSGAGVVVLRAVDLQGYKPQLRRALARRAEDV